MHLTDWSVLVVAALAFNAAATPIDNNGAALEAAVPVAKTVHSPEKRVTSKSSSKKSASKPAKKPAKKPAEKPAKKPTEKPAKKPAEKPGNKPAEKPGNKPAEKPADEVNGKTKCKRMDPNDPACYPAGHSVGKGGGSASDNLGGTGSETQIVCSYKNHWQACNTICYSTLCSPPGVVTGLVLKEATQKDKMTPRSGPLVKGNGETLVNGQLVDNRVLSGCNNNPRANRLWNDAGLERSGDSPDEWPPNAAENGGQYSDGLGVVVQMIEKSSNTHTGSFLTHGNTDGYIRLLGVKKQADVCYSMLYGTLTDVAQHYCGRDKRFGQYNREEGVFQMAFKDRSTQQPITGPHKVAT